MPAIDEFNLHQLKTCRVCGGQTQRELVELRYEFDGFAIVVRGVPAAVCQNCGERYIPGDVGVWLGDYVADIAERVRRDFADQPGVVITMPPLDDNEPRRHALHLASWVSA